MSKTTVKSHWVIYYSEEGVGPQVKMYELHAKGAHLAKGIVLKGIDGSYAEARKEWERLCEKYTPEYRSHYVRKED